MRAGEKMATVISSRRVRRALIVVLVGVAAWAVLVTATVLDTWADATQGRGDLQGLRQSIEEPTDLLSEEFAADVRAAYDRFTDIGRRLDAPWMAPARILPVAGRQLRSASALTGATETTLATLLHARDRGLDAIESPGTGGDRVRMITTLRDVVAEARADLADLDLGPDAALVGSLHDGRATLAAELDELQQAMDDAHRVLDGLLALFEGPGNYLVLAANNSEMRAGSGMVLSVGEVEFRHGEITLTQLESVTDVRVPDGIAGVDDDLAGRWGWLHPEREWRNLMASPRFPASASLAAQMWEAATGRPVDGVVAMDPLALAGLLSAVGPVDVDGGTITADEVADLLLHDQYEQFDTLAERPERQERLAAIASATLEALNTRDWDAVSLATELRAATGGRHLLAWSRHAAEQQAFAVAGVDGTLSEDSLLVSVLNRGGNKLDRFLLVRADLEHRRADDGGWDVALQLQLRNVTPMGEPPYVQGPNPNFDLAAGTYRGIVAINVPGAATDVSIDGIDRYAAAGVDGPSTVVAHQIDIPRGTNAQVTVHFRLPPGFDALRVEPSARAPAIRWSSGGRAWRDETSREVQLNGTSG